MESCKVPIGIGPALRDVGVSIADVLAAARLPAGLLDNPVPRLPVRDYFAFWKAIRAVSGRPDVGLVLAGLVKPDLTEPLFLAVLSARNGAEALDIVSAYKRVLTPQTLEIRPQARTGDMVVAYDWPDTEEDAPDVLIDAELAFLVEICRRGARHCKLAPKEVQLRRRSLETGAGHAAFFGCPLKLRAKCDAIVFAAGDLARPFSTHNPQMLDVLLPWLRRHAPAQTRSVAGRVRAAIAAVPPGRRPTLRAIGRHLGMSARAVQRALGDDGTSFRALLDEIRNEHARAYLADTAFSDGEIAFLLGFEDPNSFYRAFRAWNRQSPGEFRALPRATGQV